MARAKQVVLWSTHIMLIISTITPCSHAVCNNVTHKIYAQQGGSAQIPCTLHGTDFMYRSWFKGCFYKNDKYVNTGGTELFHQIKGAPIQKLEVARGDMNVMETDFTLEIGKAAPEDEKVFTCYFILPGSTSDKQFNYSYVMLDVNTIDEWPLPKSDIIAMSVGISVGIVLLLVILGIIFRTVKKKREQNYATVRTVSGGIDNETYADLLSKLD